MEWLRKRMIGIVIEHHHKIKGIGLPFPNLFDENEKPIKDTGLREWFCVDFGKAGKRAIDRNDIKTKRVEIVK